ncbi:MAG: phosphatidylserine/phosphatidylglycerophosphate/cardiolipin synthase family protein [Candidatus Levyibacteriota bacterium]
MEKVSFGNSVESSNRAHKSYNILETVDFLTDQLKGVQIARDRVWIQTMALESSHFSNLLARHLIDARNRGVDVRIVYDAYSDYVTDNTFNQLPLLRRTDRWHRRFVRDEQKKLLGLLRQNCLVSETNIPNGFISRVPFSVVLGRDHKKITVIDDVAYIGGVNLAPLDAQRVDFMLKTNNTSLVNKLSLIFDESFRGSPVSDASYVCDARNTLLVDSGKRGQSIIMTHAYDKIEKEGKRVTLVSPFLPSGDLRKILNKAVKRGVSVEVITSDENQLGLTPRISQMVHNAGQVKPVFEIKRYPGIIHAKALLLGDHTAIVGSHNFDKLFINLGTEEISLLTTQPEILAQLNALCERIVDTH